MNNPRVLVLSLFGAISVSAQTEVLTRGPYLQSCSSTSIVIRWRTDLGVNSEVHYGTNSTNLDRVQTLPGNRTEHEVRIAGLSADTKYYYSVGSSSHVLAVSTNHFFSTSPTTIKSTRIWAIGDFGWADGGAGMVRDSYATYSQGLPTDVWLMLGDNYYVGVQRAIFDFYPDFLRNTCFWPTLGNHDITPVEGAGIYTDAFTLPTGGQCGGVPSNSELYYSFNHANIHFVVLDSTSTGRATNGVMLQWLEQDLSAVDADWLIAIWHHPPYTKGSHDSDVQVESIDMRQNAVPILERYGVDLVLSGDSHVYERSFFINGHYGPSPTFNASMKVQAGSGRTNETGAYTKPIGRAGADRGTIYIVMGCSARGDVRYGLNHPAMYFGNAAIGSVVIDVNGNRLDAKMLVGFAPYPINDYFTIIKTGSRSPKLQISRVGSEARVSWPTNTAAFMLQSVARITQSNTWSAVTNGMMTNNGENVVNVPFNGTNQFFRLQSSP